MTDECPDIFERLHGNARTNPIPSRVLDIADRAALGEARTLVAHAVRSGWTADDDLARRTGHGADIVTGFRCDRRGDRSVGLEATIASDLARAVNQILREREAEQTEITGFVGTRAAQAIFGIVRYAVRRRKVGVFVMPAGLGKTTALQALAVETPGAALVTVTQPRCTVASFLRLWARGLGLTETGRAEDLEDRIGDCLCGSQRVILIDEAHKLCVAALDVIRGLWDAARVPIVMAATPSFYQTMTARRVGTHSRELMDQFYSRVGIFRDLTGLRVGVEDIRKLYVRELVRLAPDAGDFLCRVANTPGGGGLRTCTDLVQLVVDLYPGDIVSAQLLREALRTRPGAREAGLLLETAETVYAKVAATA